MTRGPMDRTTRSFLAAGSNIFLKQFSPPLFFDFQRRSIGCDGSVVRARRRGVRGARFSCRPARAAPVLRLRRHGAHVLLPEETAAQVTSLKLRDGKRYTERL